MIHFRPQLFLHQLWSPGETLSRSALRICPRSRRKSENRDYQALSHHETQPKLKNGEFIAQSLISAHANCFFVFVWGVFFIFFFPPRCPANSHARHGPGEPGRVSGGPAGQRHGGPPGWAVRNHHRHRQAERRQRQPASLQTQWVAPLSDRSATSACLPVCVREGTDWNDLVTECVFVPACVHVCVCVAAALLHFLFMLHLRP